MATRDQIESAPRHREVRREKMQDFCGTEHIKLSAAMVTESG